MAIANHIVLATKVHGNMHKGDTLDPNQWATAGGRSWSNATRR